MNKDSGGHGIPAELLKILKVAALNMSANLENSAMASGLEKVSFHSNPKEGQRQRKLKLLYNCADFTCQQGNSQNPSSQASAVPELKTYKCTNWVQKRQMNIYFCFIDYKKPFHCVDHNKLWKILKGIGIPDHLTCFLRNPYVGQETTGRTGHGRTDWFKIGKGVHQGCILSSCLFNLYAGVCMHAC